MSDHELAWLEAALDAEADGHALPADQARLREQLLAQPEGRDAQARHRRYRELMRDVRARPAPSLPAQLAPRLTLDALERRGAALAAEQAAAAPPPRRMPLGGWLLAAAAVLAVVLIPRALQHSTDPGDSSHVDSPGSSAAPLADAEVEALFLAATQAAERRDGDAARAGFARVLAARPAQLGLSDKALLFLASLEPEPADGLRHLERLLRELPDSGETAAALALASTLASDPQPWVQRLRDEHPGAVEAHELTYGELEATLARAKTHPDEADALRKRAMALLSWLERHAPGSEATEKARLLLRAE